MTLKEAQRILECLSMGEDPFCDEPLRHTEACADETIQQALQKILYAVKDTKDTKKTKLKTRAEIKKHRPANSGSPWKYEDDELLLALYDKNVKNEEICQQLARSEAAIAARLVRLGKIETRAEFRKRH